MVPCNSCYGKATVISGKVYYGGGNENNLGDERMYVIHCYDTSQDKWSSLPPLPISYFGMGQVNGKLVTIGGIKNEKKGNEVHTFMEQKLKWKKTILPMPTSRNSPGILSLPSVLIVAGGHTESNWIYAPAVEIFKPDVSQWYTTDPLPTPCTNVSLTSVGNICYTLGGFSSPWHLNHALYASVDDLLLNAVPANQTTHRDTQSAWKTLSNTPNYGPSAGVLGGTFLRLEVQKQHHHQFRVP